MASAVKLGRILREEAAREECWCPLNRERCMGARCMKWQYLVEICGCACPCRKECNASGGDCLLTEDADLKTVGFCTL